VAFAAAKAALLEWDRKSELSADRAGLLACQDPAAAYRALMKTAGGSRHAEMDLNEFFRQARDYDAAAEGLDSLYKFLDLVGESHPFPAVRMTALQEWERGGGYEAVLRDEYPRRAADGAPGADASREARGGFEAAGAEYRREFAASQDPLAQAAGKVMDALGGVFEGLRGAASGFPRGGDGGDGEPGGASGSAGANQRNGAGEGGQPRKVEDLLDELFGKKPR
ncbi:MAG: M48 family metalloprotease, partial [Spirochaetaceae bacterium]|nr:M48 family metalloprotease [Spirochaetaceae bacterium]